MPFIQRTITPYNPTLHQRKKKTTLFQSFNDVSNQTMTGVIMQLASICQQAEDIFGALNIECKDVNRRCKSVSQRIRNLQVRVDSLNAKTVLIPVSDLDVERGIPIYLHYQAPNSIEEDLFTRDTRIPCVIHLHQKATHDFNHILRGSDAYAKPLRPKSLDPRLLMEESFAVSDSFSPSSPRNSSFFSSSAHVNPKVKEDQNVSLPNPDQKMKLDLSSSNTDIIKVDTSGAKFERQANLRRSQRLSSCSSVKQRANASQRRQQRHKHKTLIGIPGNTSIETGDESIIRPYSLYSSANNSTGFRTELGSSDESQSIINGHVVVSPNQKNAEIQTDEVKVLPITPSQRRMKQKGIRSNHASPASSHGSTEFLASPTAVPCPTIPIMKQQTSTPINGVHERDLVRPTSLDVRNDTSTDEGRHTGESNPPTPVRNGTPQELSASPHLKPSPSSPMATKANNVKPNNIALRMNGARQGEDRASSGFWSGTESNQHSSSSDITAQHAQVTKALQNMVRPDRRSPVYSNSAGKKSPLVDNRPWITSSAISSSTVSINSKLSTLDAVSTASLRDDDDRFHSMNSSVISVTLSRSNNNSTLSLNSEGGTAISAAAMLKKTRKGRINASSGAYNFMNYEVDPLENGNDEISRAVKSRRSARSGKHRGGNKKRLHTPEDTISMSSMADSSPQNTDVDGHSVHSASRLTNDTASLCESMFSVDQEGYYTSMQYDCGIPKSVSPCAKSITSVADSVVSDTSMSTPTPVVANVQPKVKIISPKRENPQAFFGDEFKGQSTGQQNNYNSYNRAVNSNHSTPKSLLTPRGKSQSVKVQSTSSDLQSELNKRLSLRTKSDAKKSSTKKKRGAPPPPPRRASSLSGSSSPSPTPSLTRKANHEKELSPLVSNSTTAEKLAPAIVPMTPLSPEVFYMQTLPPPPPTEDMDFPPPPEELLNFETEKSNNSTPDSLKSSPAPDIKPPPPPQALSPSQCSQSPQGTTSPVHNAQVSPKSGPGSPQGQPYFSIAMQAAALGNRFSDKKKSATEKNKKVVSETKVITSPDATKIQEKKEGNDSKLVTSPQMMKKQTSPTVNKIEPLSVKPTTDAKRTPPPVAPKSTPFKATKTPPKISPKPTKPGESFDTKRTREQSPSYRASVARAAFFSNVTTSDTTKNEKISNQQSEHVTDKEIPVESSTEDKTAIDDVDSPVETVETNDAKQNTITNEQNKDDAVEVSPVKVEEVKDEEISQVNENIESEPVTESVPAQDNTDWLGQIDEFSAPNCGSKSPSPDRMDAPKVAPKPTPKFSSYDTLMDAIHKSKRETLSGKATASPPSSPGVNGEVFSYNKSPGSTLERKRNGRLSSNGTRNGISRKSTGATSRDDFKALLLQNACRESTGSQMSAMEKLQLKKPSGNSAKAALSRQRPHSVADILSDRTTDESPQATEETENTRPLLSLNDIRSAITSGSATMRQGRSTARKGTKSAALELGAKPYATLSAMYGKKHPPRAMSSKYNTRSRTPTRPMMSISEDSETEKSPEQVQKAAAET